MPSISNHMTHTAYTYSKMIYLGEMTQKIALQKIMQESGMAYGSASDYIAGLKYMLNGECYKRTLNNYATRYILGQIKTDFDEITFNGALNSVGQHIKYYESLNHGRLRGILKIFNEFSAVADIENLYPDELPETVTLVEGAKKQISINIYERNPKARRACIEHYGVKCAICEFDFLKKYGPVGRGFVHVHHLVEISKIGDGCTVNPIDDLRPVCPNCHAMLHQKNPAYSIAELKGMIEKTGK